MLKIIEVIYDKSIMNKYNKHSISNIHEKS